MAMFGKARDLVRAPLAPLMPPKLDQIPEEPEEEELELTLVEHLDELRSRIVKILISLVIATVIAFMFTPTLFNLLLSMAPPDLQQEGLVVSKPTEAFMTYFQVSFMAGIGLAMPVILYHLLAFVLPALTRREKRLLFYFMPLVVIFFFFGLAFGYMITIPFALDFLYGFDPGGIFRKLITAESYLDFVTTFLLWMGFAFELPIVIFFLAKVGVVKTPRLVAWRKYAILGAFVLAAIITPTPDPLNQALVAIPLWILYEIGIVLSRFG